MIPFSLSRIVDVSYMSVNSQTILSLQHRYMKIKDPINDGIKQIRRGLLREDKQGSRGADFSITPSHK